MCLPCRSWWPLHPLFSSRNCLLSCFPKFAIGNHNKLNTLLPSVSSYALASFIRPRDIVNFKAGSYKQRTWNKVLLMKWICAKKMSQSQGESYLTLSLGLTQVIQPKKPFGSLHPDRHASIIFTWLYPWAARGRWENSWSFDLYFPSSPSQV